MASFLKFPKNSQRKRWNLPLSTTPLSFDAPSPENLREYSHKSYTARNYSHWIQSLAYISAADSRPMCLSLFKFLRWTPKDVSFLQESAYRPFKVIQNRWFWHQRKGVYNFLLVINSNYGPILHRFWDTATYWLKTANFFLPHSHLTPSPLVRGEPFRISGFIFMPKSWKLVLWLSVGEDFVILTCIVASVWRTDGWTDGQSERS